MNNFIVIETYSRIVNENIKKIDFEYENSEDIVNIECENIVVTLSGTHFNNIKQLSKMNKIQIENFWNDIFGHEIKTIKWCKYKNNKNKYVTINDKEFTICEEDDPLNISFNEIENYEEMDIE